MSASYQPENMLRTSPVQTLSSKVNAEVGAVLAGQTGRAHRGATHLTADARPGLNPGHLPPGRHRQSFSPKCSSFLEVPYQMRVLEPCAHTHPCTPRSGAQLPRPSSGRAEPHRAVEPTQVFRVRAHSDHRGSMGKMLLRIFGRDRDPRRD